MFEFSTYVAFKKATNEHTDLKNEMGKTLGSLSLLKIVGEKLRPSQRSRLEMMSCDRNRLPGNNRGYHDEHENDLRLSLILLLFVGKVLVPGLFSVVNAVRLRQ